MINENTKDNRIIDGIDYHEIIDCITGALDVKDPYTADHSKRVSNMAEKVCKILGLNDIETEKIHIAAHLHDIGKIGVPDAILNKFGKLTEEEWKKIKEHPKIGAEILNKSIHLKEISIIVLYHHERYDGKGYPEGIAGLDIPLGSRIIAICDSIDAMSMKRSYREAFNLDYCYNEIKSNLGKMYDPLLGEKVLENWEYILENSKFNGQE
jgi:putative nucleotidyltransferase with HDIG domain